MNFFRCKVLVEGLFSTAPGEEKEYNRYVIEFLREFSDSLVSSVGVAESVTIKSTLDARASAYFVIEKRTVEVGQSVHDGAFFVDGVLGALEPLTNVPRNPAHHWIFVLDYGSENHTLLLETLKRYGFYQGSISRE
jgi:hypothetical protein